MSRIAFLAVAFALLSFAAARADVTQTSVVVGVHGNVQAQLFVPDGPGPFPGVLVLHTSGGLRDADLATARALAYRGYVCLVPAFMAAYGITYDTRSDTFGKDGDAIYADLASALGTLQNNPAVRGAKVGAIGFSNGGYFAVWLALTGKVQAAVSYYGAYTAAGTNDDETRFKKLATATAAPILILHGMTDDTVPVAAARRLAGILAGASAPYEMQLYPDTGHSFDRGDFTPPSGFRGGNRAAHGGAGNVEPGDAAAATDAWSRTLAFFEKYLQ